MAECCCMAPLHCALSLKLKTTVFISYSQKSVVMDFSHYMWLHAVFVWRSWLSMTCWSLMTDCEIVPTESHQYVQMQSSCWVCCLVLYTVHYKMMGTDSRELYYHYLSEIKELDTERADTHCTPWQSEGGCLQALCVKGVTMLDKRLAGAALWGVRK